MKAAINKRKRGARLAPADVKAYKKLARRIDEEEGDEIRAMGKEIFKRHGIAREMVHRLRAKRLENAMSLTELSLRTGIAKSNLSRLENNERVSPTLETLHRYAQALGLKMRVELN
jgi:DNA-binding Xre family transcriptional regulator